MKIGPRASRRALAFVLLAMCCAVLLGTGATGSMAAPAQPTLTVDQLQALLDASPGGTVDGYFKTVLKGTDIVEIPVTVQSTVPYSIPEGSLILFQARGDAMEQIGGIAHGMSGSPLYVSDKGVDKLVGAVSYGDVFTRGLLGLATPVEYMASMEDTYLPVTTTSSLAHAVRTPAGAVRRVVVARSARAARALPRRAGTAVMAPLATIAIAGLPPRSAAYKHLASVFASHGFDVAPYGALLTGSSANVQTTLTGGAGVAVLMARGDVIFGAAGTVTWRDGDRVVLFGHPFSSTGAVQYYLTGAVVNGIWSSNMDPYKLMTPTGVEGTVLQDRGSGVAALVGAAPAEAPISARVSMQPGPVVGSGLSYMPQWELSGDDALLAADVAAAAGYRATDNAGVPGGAETTTTIVVSDGVNPPSTVVRTDTWDSAYDVAGTLPQDIASMLAILVDDPDGVAPATILSVDLQAAASPARTAARITGVSFPDGLKAGAANLVDVQLAAYGQATPVTLAGRLRLPSGSATTGSINVYPAVQGPTPPDSGLGARRSARADDGRQTLAQRIDEVKALPTNDQLVVSFTPDSGVTPLTGTVVAPVVQSVQTTLTAPGRYISGSLQRRVAHLSVKATPASSAYQGSVLVSGRLGETDGSAKVDLFGEPLGGQRFKIATVTAAADGSGGAAFKYKVSGLTVSTRLVAEWSGDAVAIGGSASTHVDVRQRVSLRAGQTGVAPGAAVKLVADVRPGAAGQTVWFERKTAAGWTTIRGVKLLADLTAALIWQPPAGASTVRARVAATAVNAAGASAQLTITARGR